MMRHRVAVAALTAGAAAAAIAATPTAGAAVAPAPAAATAPAFPAGGDSYVDRRTGPAAAAGGATLAEATYVLPSRDDEAVAAAWRQMVVDLPDPPEAFADYTTVTVDQPAGDSAQLVDNDADGIALAVHVAAQVGLTGDALVTAVAIAGAESRWRPDINNAGMNTNGTVDYGLWQINTVHSPPVPAIYDPVVNAEFMYRVSSGGTVWTPWVVYNTGAYQRYLDVAADAVELAGLR